MPLIQSKSKKAFQKNVETEMKENPGNKAQDLAIAYNIKRKNAKKMAKGGKVSEDAPQASPEQKIARPDMGWGAIIAKAEGGLVDSKWTDQPTVQQAQSKPRFQPMKRPKMVPSSSFSTKLQGEEDDLQMMAEGGMTDAGSGDSERERAERDQHIVDPGNKMKKMAEGGMAHEMDMQPEEEAEEEHHDSIASAIMARKHKMAEGGMVDIEENAEEEPNFYDEDNSAILKENYDSDMEDDAQPMDSNEQGHELSDEDTHDMVGKIRRKMNMHRQFRSR